MTTEVLEKKLQELSEATQTMRKSFEDFEAGAKSVEEMKGKQLEFSDIITTLETEVKGIKENLNKPQFKKFEQEEKMEVEKEIYYKALRFGVAKLTEEEKNTISKYRPRMENESEKGLSEGTDTAGGYLVRDDIRNEMIRKVEEVSPIFQNVTVKQTSGRSVLAPSEKDFALAYWDDELEDLKVSNPTFGREQIQVHKLRSSVYVTLEELEDAVFNLPSELNRQFGIKSAQKMNQAFINGTSVKQPEGFLVNSKVGSFKNGHATVIQPDALLKLPYQILTEYKNMGKPQFYMNRLTTAEVRILKDSQNRYLWNPGLNGGQQDGIAGFPLVETPDMPDIAANAFPILFGSLDIAYWAVMRTQMVVTRNPFVAESSDEIRFTSRMRVGGQVVQPEAIIKFKMEV